MADNDGDLGSFVAGFLIGGLIGAGVALLLAPQSGEETREMLRERGIELKSRAEEAATEFRSKAETYMEEGRERVEGRGGIRPDAGLAPQTRRRGRRSPQLTRFGPPRPADQTRATKTTPGFFSGRVAFLVSTGRMGHRRLTALVITSRNICATFGSNKIPDCWRM